MFPVVCVPSVVCGAVYIQTVGKLFQLTKPPSHMFTLSQCSFFYASLVWYCWAYRDFSGNTSNKSCSVTLFRLDWQTGMLSDSLLIVFISIFTALLSEGFSWLLIYRTDKYKRLQSEVEKQSKKRKFQVQKTLPAILDQDSNCQLVVRQSGEAERDDRRPQ